MAPALPSVRSSFLFNILRWPLWSGCFSWCSKQTVRALKCLLPPGASLPDWGSIYGWLSPRPFQWKVVVTLQYKFLENLEGFRSFCFSLSVCVSSYTITNFFFGHAYYTRFISLLPCFHLCYYLETTWNSKIWWDDNIHISIFCWRAMSW